MVQPDHGSYLRSLAFELEASAQRVRNLIGDAHWLSDGRHKEFLLAELVRRHCPSGVRVATGFVKDPALPDCVSHEQDILIADTTAHAPLFDQGGLVVASPSQVLATISVKSTMNSETVRQSLDNQFAVRHIACQSGLEPSSIWCGAFFYTASPAIVKDPTKPYTYVNAWVKDNKAATATERAPLLWRLPDTLCCLPEFLYRIDQSTEAPVVRGFRSSSMSIAVFLVLLLGHIAHKRGGRFTTCASLVEDGGGTPLSPADYEIV